MSNRELFANTITDLCSHATHFENECERFGMTWGCREDCPALEKGNCEHWKTVDEYLGEMESK
jgi:hypothetical protein